MKSDILLDELPIEPIAAEKGETIAKAEVEKEEGINSDDDNNNFNDDDDATDKQVTEGGQVDQVDEKPTTAKPVPERPFI